MHAKPAPPVEVSVRFLCSYVNSLHALELAPIADIKGKMVSHSHFPHMAACKNIGVTPSCPWFPPEPGRVKLNTDGSVAKGTAGAGMILRDHAGSIIFNSCRYLFTCEDALEAEILALKEGLSLALQWSNSPIDIESDSLEAVTMVKSDQSNMSKYSFFIREIEICMGERDTCITHIRRSANNASHFMANFGRLQGRTAVWLSPGPEEVLNIVGRDCNP